MAFGDQVKRFTEKAKLQLEDVKKQVEANAKQRLVDILGDDVGRIRGIKLDTDIGKFYDIDAPEEIIERLRSSGVVKEETAKVLLLGGSQHLRTLPVDLSFGTPISHCNGVALPERYHRAVFYPSGVDASVANVWYVYVADDYQLQSGQLTEAELIDALNKSGIAPHIVSVDLENLKHEPRLKAV